MTTTYPQFVEALADIEVEAVKRKHASPPAKAPASSDLPASFVVIPRGSEGGDQTDSISFDGEGGWPRFVATHMVALEPVVENIPRVNFENAVQMMQNVSDALRSVSSTTRPGKGALRWSTAVVTEEIGGKVYWAVATNVQGAG